MIKKSFLIITLILLIVLTSCTSPLVNRGKINRMATQNFFEGTQGLVLDFVDQAPPTEIYETSDFDVQVFISNKGAFSLFDHYVAKTKLIYDSSKATKITDKTVGYYRDAYTKNGIVLLYGKSYYYPSGEQNYFPIDRFRASEVRDGFETTNLDFSVSICYPYETVFAESICIDSDPQKIDIRNDACQAQDKTYSKGQGAPVEITAVDVQMIPRGSFVQPRFIIYVDNAADGIVYDFQESALEKVSVEINSRMEDRYTCGDMSKARPNMMQIEAYLGEEKLDCSAPVLKAEDTRIECQLSESKIPGNVANYMTSLRINLKYFYTQIYSTKTEIKQVDDSLLSRPKPQGQSYCPAWQTYDSKTENCIDNCKYFVNSDKNTLVASGLVAPLDQDWDSLSCMYTTPDSCRDANELCTLSEGLCMKGTYCGWPKCLNDNTPPVIGLVTPQGSPVNRITFSCADDDDGYDLQRTCGCSNQAYYLFVEKGTNCGKQEISTFKVLEGRTDSSLRMVYDLPIPENSEKLCIAVKDNLGTFSDIEVADI